ncbi:aminoglycoside phosphotransferase family protein [Pseudomonas sp. zfem002]|nr:aminoglycoside phosphotransferase family protein [Pseudomonas sp. zfem002]MDU9391817.1 aminoglycoside phosphotransferase family protein [Pseudomonas sp. zfem002]
MMFDNYLQHWHLTPDGHPITTRGADLLPVRQHGRPAMLKLAHEAEEQAGAQLMIWWNGDGAAPVLAHDERALLLQRATGPASLTKMVRDADDDQATRILCSVVARLHTPRPGPPPPLVPLTRWFDALLDGTHDPLLQTCAATARELLATPRDVTVLHGDIHHGNVLDFGPSGWLAIDPKGLYGERGFDYANLFCNPDGRSALRHFAQRLDTVSNASGIERRRLLQWILAWAGLSACWMDEDGGDPTHLRDVAKLAAAALNQGVQSTRCSSR